MVCSDSLHLVDPCQYGAVGGSLTTLTQACSEDSPSPAFSLLPLQLWCPEPPVLQGPWVTYRGVPVTRNFITWKVEGKMAGLFKLTELRELSEDVLLSSGEK